MTINTSRKDPIMFTKNVGTADRAIRIIAGLALITAFFFSSRTGLSWFYLLGIVPLATGLIGSCPPYSLLGINTCSLKK